MEIRTIAHIHTDFPEKFGIPRQSGLADTKAEIIFEPEFASPEAVRGLESYSYIWIIWAFSANEGKSWHPTVRPPRLGGNTRTGVFATRSPFRPNPLGLSSVKLEFIEMRKGTGPVLHVSGADLMDQTPIFDIKPYLPYADAHPEAAAGFTDAVFRQVLPVHYSEEALHAGLPSEKLKELTEILAQDPRPSYQHDPARVYGMSFAGYTVKFSVREDEIDVRSIQRNPDGSETPGH